jgi:hypothetical protein
MLFDVATFNSLKVKLLTKCVLVLFLFYFLINSSLAQRYSIQTFDPVFCGTSFPTAYQTGSFSINANVNCVFRKDLANTTFRVELTGPFEFNTSSLTSSVSVGGTYITLDCAAPYNEGGGCFRFISNKIIEIRYTTANVNAIDEINFNDFQIRATGVGSGTIIRNGGTAQIKNITGGNDCNGTNYATSNPTGVFGTLLSSPPATYNFSEVIQASNGVEVKQYETDKDILRINVNITGSCASDITSFSFNTSGDDGTNLTSNITQAKVYYTASSSSFNTTNLFGTFNAPNGTFTVAGLQTLSDGDNYFWLTYDISGSASTDAITPQNRLDAQLVNFIFNSTTITDAATPNPVGHRPIVGADFYYSRENGTWNNNTTLWATEEGGPACGCQPSGGGVVVIMHDIQLDQDRVVGVVEIRDGGILRHNNQERNLTVNSTFTTIGSGYFDLRCPVLSIGGNTSLGGTGTCQNTLRMNFGGNLVIGANKTLVGTGKNGNNDQRIEIKGNINVNGVLSRTGGSGGDRNIYWNGTSGTLDGTGTIDVITGGSFFIDNSNKTVSSTANLVINANVEIQGARTITNNGTVRLNGTINGTVSTSTWRNGNNSVLIYTNSAAMFATNGRLIANNSGNSVRYNGTANQTIFATTYHHLVINGSATASLSGNTTINGNITIGASATYNGNNFITNLNGNWINNGGNFTPGTAAVRFIRNGNQHFTGTKNNETFGTLVVTSTSTLNITSTYTITATTLTNNGAINNSGILRSGNGFNTSTAILSGNGTHELTGGNWTNGTGFSMGTSNVVFSGSAAQTISGTTTFYNLEINNPSGVSILTDVINIDNTLTLTSGNFNTNNNLVLVPNTGRIGTITGGSISGNVTAQRFISGPESWRLLSSPVSSNIFDWQDNFWTSGFPDATYPSYYGFVSLYTYDETLSGIYEYGYVAPSSASDALSPGTGYMAWIGGWPVGTAYTGTIDVTGPVFTGNLSKNITYTPENGDDYDGWNLIANPYPSDIDMGNVSRTASITPFIYLYDPSLGDFVPSDWTAGTKIAQHQAFWVKASMSAGTVSFTENAKSAGSVSMFREAPMKNIFIKLEGMGYELVSEVRFNDEATPDYDAFFDAYKVASLDYYAPNISTICSNGESLAINTIPDSIKSFSIPIKVIAADGMSGNYTLKIEDNLKILANRPCLFLEDTKENITINLKEQNEYTFYLSDTESNNRFILHTSDKFETELIKTSCFKGNDGQIIVNLPNHDLWNVRLSDNSGETIELYENLSQTDTIKNLNATYYFLEISKNDGTCSTPPISYLIEAPEVIQSNIEKHDITCFGENNGELITHASGGTGNLNFKWSNGSSDVSLSQMEAGYYQLTITDENNCFKIFDTYIEEPNEILAELVSYSSCANSNNGKITAHVAGGVSPYQYVWNNNSTDAELEAIAPGDYILSITDSNNCIKIYQTEVAAYEILNTTFESNNFCENHLNEIVILGETGGTFSLEKNLNDDAFIDEETGIIHQASSGNTYTITYTLYDENLCLSASSVQISTFEQIETYQSFNICYGESIIVGSSNYTESGNYINYFYTHQGCDSTVYTTIQKADEIAKTINLKQDTLIASHTNEDSYYQWIDCNTQLTIEGAIDPKFFPFEDGIYALQITHDNCSITTDCIPYTRQISGINNQLDEIEISLYPNPNNGNFILKGGKLNEIQHIVIHDVTGRLVWESNHVLKESLNIQLNANTGVYFITFTFENKEITSKFLIK